MLTLDTRQRAMLEAMRVPVWLPTTAAAALPVANPLPGSAAPDSVATNNIAARAYGAGVTGTFDTKGSASTVPAAPAAVAPSAGAYALLPLVQPYPVVTGAAGQPIWLVVVEADGGEAGPPFRGDAGRLLDAMLRALRLPRNGNVHLARLVRAGTAPAEHDGAAALAHGLAQLRPAVVLAMGRVAAQQLLGTSEPLGRLRGRAHGAAGVPVVVTYDAAYLLRAQPDKARAWADLCLASAIAHGLSDPEPTPAGPP